MAVRPVASNGCEPPRRAQAKLRGVGWGVRTSIRWVRAGGMASNRAAGRALKGRVGASALERESFWANMTAQSSTRFRVRWAKAMCLLRIAHEVRRFGAPRTYMLGRAVGDFVATSCAT
jgi:hypothetical protein